MKQTHLLLAFLLLGLLTVAGCADQIDHYPTADRPGLKPMLFAPGLISTEGHRERDLAISPDWSEIYFSRDATIMVTTRTPDGWSEPQPVSFSYPCPEFEPFITHDNRRLYFISRRPLAGEGEPEDYQLWMVDRTPDGWGTPKRVTDVGDFYASMTESGLMYFTDIENDICRSVLTDGRPTDREKLGDSVNTADDEYNSFVAPDETYLLFSSTGWGNSPGQAILYASYRDQNDVWSRPVNLGSGVNRATMSYCPSLSPDGKYLFFASRSGSEEDIYWVDASLIDHARTTDLDFRCHLLTLAVDSSLSAFESQLTEVESQMSDCADLNADLLNSVADLLATAGHDAKAAGLMRISSTRFQTTESPIWNLKLAILEQDQTIWQQTIDGIKSDSIATHENDINILGYQFLAADRTDDATRLFRANTEIFPASANVFDSYGEVLLSTGDTLGAIDNYRRSLELNPDNINATLVLERLGME